MSVHTVTQYVKSYIKANFTECEGRALLVASEVGYVLSGKHKNVGVAIVYAGGDPADTKPNAQSEDIMLDIFIFSTIWKEEKVVEGEGSRKGLLELRDILRDLLKNHLFGNIRDVSVIDLYGTKDYPNIGAPGFSANIGFRIKYKEQLS